MTPTPVNRSAFLDAMSHIAASVHLVTTDGRSGAGGITVSSMTSVSADPPTILICIHHASAMAQLIPNNARFVVNTLPDEAHDLSDAFAGRIEHEAVNFSSDLWQRTTQGLPALNTAIVRLECELIKHDRVSSHEIFYGLVNHVYSRDGRPLLYHRRRYTQTGQQLP